MRTVTEYPVYRNPVQHYAHYYGIEGIATLIPGGYTFLPTGCDQIHLVGYRDPELQLFECVDAQQSLMA